MSVYGAKCSCHEAIGPRRREGRKNCRASASLISLGQAYAKNDMTSRCAMVGWPSAKSEFMIPTMISRDRGARLRRGTCPVNALRMREFCVSDATIGKASATGANNKLDVAQRRGHDVFLAHNGRKANE